MTFHYNNGSTTKKKRIRLCSKLFSSIPTTFVHVQHAINFVIDVFIVHRPFVMYITIGIEFILIVKCLIKLVFDYLK